MAFVMTFLSPMLWYLNKVHTELFTYVLTLLATAFVYRRYLLPASLCLALASTQNPSFAIIAFIPFFYRVVMVGREKFTGFEVVCAMGTALFVLLHPVYYFFRYGVPTPQLLAGGASLGGNLDSFYIWFFDPDLGLFPYWPLGILFVALALIYIRLIKADSAPPVRQGNLFFIFILLFVLVNIYAHSSTTNLNSGATRGPARYSLWYMPIFFPVLLFVVRSIPKRSAPLFVMISGVLMGGWFNFVLSDPAKAEDYSTPSYLSRFVQLHLSRIYSPPTEVFSERYSGFGEAIHSLRPRAILGPDCSKMLVYPGSDRVLVTIPPRCFFDVSALQKKADLIANESSSKGPIYVYLSEEQQRDVMLQIYPGEYVVGSKGNGNFVLNAGWSGLEDFGVWSEGRRAKMSLPCLSSNFYFGRNKLNLKITVQPFGRQDIVIKHGDYVAFQGVMQSEREVNIELHPYKCKATNMDVDISIAHPRSPLELGQSNDPRKLGIALLRFEVK